jgi:predicted amidohydrolase
MRTCTQTQAQHCARAHTHARTTRTEVTHACIQLIPLYFTTLTPSAPLTPLTPLTLSLAHSTPLHSTPLHSTPLHSTPHHTTQHNTTPLHTSSHHSIPIHFTPLHSLYSFTHPRAPLRTQLLLFAETLASGYPGTDVRPFVENVSTSPYLARFRDLSKSASVTIAIGFLMATPPDVVSKYGVPVRDAVIVYEDGNVLGIHTKSSLWPDDKRPWRDERMLYANGTGPTRFESKLGRFGLLICYENTAPENWWEQMLGTPSKRAQFDFMLSPYDAEGDTSEQTASKAAKYAIPTVWTNRVGTVYEGTFWEPNNGAAGSADSSGNITFRTTPGVESILHTTISYSVQRK